MRRSLVCLLLVLSVVHVDAQRARARRVRARPTALASGALFTGTTRTAATCSRADVNTQIAASSALDIVVVPNGSCTWATGVTISGIYLKGASEGGVTITNGAGSATLITVTKTSASYTAIGNLVIVRGTSTSRHIDVGGSGKPILLHHNAIQVDEQTLQPIRFSSNGGVIWSNTFTGGVGSPSGGCGGSYAPYHNEGAIQVNPDADGDTLWNAAATIGTNDTTGENNIYFEDNTFTGLLQQSVDGSNGAKVVFRYNQMNDSALVMHGADTDQFGGNRHWEVYNNTFNRVYANAPVNNWIYVRGATGVFTDNVFEEAGSEGGSIGDTGCYPGKPEIDLTIQNLRRNAGDYPCWNAGDGGYPAPHQIGQLTHARDATPDFPVAIWNNTGAGTMTIDVSNYEPDECGGGDDAATYVTLGRDYITSAASGYTKYTYPHPLRSGV